MIKTKFISVIFIALGHLLLATIHAQQGVEATIHFSDGNIVRIIEFGTERDRSQELGLRGIIGGQTVFYPFSALAEVHFAEYQRVSYVGRTGGQALLIGRNETRMIMDNAILHWRRGPNDFVAWGQIEYYYQDPLTNSIQRAQTPIRNRVSHITMGDKVGSHRKNPVTGEIFPSSFVYDPFTGQRLEWADH